MITRLRKRFSRAYRPRSSRHSVLCQQGGYYREAAAVELLRKLLPVQSVHAPGDRVAAGGIGGLSPMPASGFGTFSVTGV